jgi:16S rRNA processing protein RimM
MNGMDRLVLVARVAGAFGVRGEVRLRSFTEDPMALVRFRQLRGEGGAPGLTLLSGRPYKEGLIARAEEIATKEQADGLRGLELYAPRSVLPPPGEDEFYLADLIGLEARSPEGAALGKIRAVPNYGAGDLLEVEPAGGGSSWLVAFTAGNVPEVDVEGGQVVIVRPSEAD